MRPFSFSYFLLIFFSCFLLVCPPLATRATYTNDKTTAFLCVSVSNCALVRSLVVNANNVFFLGTVRISTTNPTVDGATTEPYVCNAANCLNNEEGEATSNAFVQEIIDWTPATPVTLLTVTILAGLDRAKLGFPGILIRLIAVNADIRPLFGVASMLRSIPILTVIIQPLPQGTLAVAGLDSTEDLLFREDLDRGILSFDVTAAAYVIATVSVAMTNKGSIALITGPYSATIGLIRSVTSSSVQTHCPACVYNSVYLSSSEVVDTATVVATYYRMREETQVDYDVLMVEAPGDVVLEIQSILNGNTSNLSYSVFVTCFLCDKPPFSATVAHKLLGPMLLKAMVTKLNSVVSFTDEQGVRLSLCQECLSPRAIRSFADTTSRVFSIVLNDPLGIWSVINMPVRGPFSLIRAVYDSTTALKVPFQFDPKPFVGAGARPALPPYATIASTCLQTPKYGIECAVIAVSKLRKMTLIDSGINEWITPFSITVSSSISHLPEAGYSLTAVSPKHFLVFGGFETTSQSWLVNRLDTLFMLTLRDAPTTTKATLTQLSPINSASNRPRARSHHAHVAVPDFGGIEGRVVVYIHGGVGQGETQLSDLWKYDVTANNWTQLASSTIPRYGHTLFFLRRLHSPVLFMIEKPVQGSSTSYAELLEIGDPKSLSEWKKIEVPNKLTKCGMVLDDFHLVLISSLGAPCVVDMMNLRITCDSSVTLTPTSLFDSSNTAATLDCAPLIPFYEQQGRLFLLITQTTATRNFTLSDVSVLQIANDSCVSSMKAINSNVIRVGNETCSLCAPGQFSYERLCVPCERTNVSWAWPNTVLFNDSYRLTIPTYYSACVKSGEQAPETSIPSSISLILTIFLLGLCLGYGFFVMRTMPHNARHLRDAPIVLPVTLIFVDVHHGLKTVQRTSTSCATFIDHLGAISVDCALTCGAYRVKRIGDGILFAASDVGKAVRLCKVIRQQMRSHLHEQWIDHLQRTKRPPAAHFIDSTSSVKSADGGGFHSKPQTKRQSYGLWMQQARLLKFCIHTSNCLELVYRRGTIDYVGPDALFSHVVSHSITESELALTLEALGAMEELHAAGIAQGKHLRANKADKTQEECCFVAIDELMAPLTLQREMNNGSSSTSSPVGAQKSPTEQSPPKGGGLVSPATLPLISSPVSPLTPSTVMERLCLNGMRIKVWSLVTSDDKELETELAALFGLTPNPPSGHDNLNRKNEDSVGGDDGEHVTDSPPISAHPVPRPGTDGGRMSVFGASTTFSATAASVDDSVTASHLREELDLYFDFLDDPELHGNAEISRTQFATLRLAVMLVLQTVSLALDDDLKDEFLEDLAETFCLNPHEVPPLSVTSLRSLVNGGPRSFQSKAERLLQRTSEGSVVHLLHRISARVLQISQSSEARRLLLIRTDKYPGEGGGGGGRDMDGPGMESGSLQGAPQQYVRPTPLERQGGSAVGGGLPPRTPALATQISVHSITHQDGDGLGLEEVTLRAEDSLDVGQGRHLEVAMPDDVEGTQK